MTELMCLVGEGGVWDDAQLADLWGRGDGASIIFEDEVTHPLEQGHANIQTHLPSM